MPPKEKVELFKKLGIGGIIRMDQDGKNREVYATGLRNPVGLDFNPKDKALWSNDNQVDGMGDDIPPGELNRIDQGRARSSASRGTAAATSAPTSTRTATPPADVVFPVVETVAHAADLGMVFYTGNTVPARATSGAIFSTQHGSWNRTVPVGARVMFTRSTTTARAGPGGVRRRLADDDGEYIGRPVDVQQLATARCWSPTISPAPSIASITTASRTSLA